MYTRKRRSTGTLYSSSDVRRSLDEATESPEKIRNSVMEELENLSSYADEFLASLNSAMIVVETEDDVGELKATLKGMKDVEKGITSAQGALEKWF